MKLWLPNNKNSLKKTILGCIPQSNELGRYLKKPVPKFIDKVLDQTQEDLEQIKTTFEGLGVEVLQYPITEYQGEDSINVRNGFIVVDDHLYITARVPSLEPFYHSVENKTFVEHQGGYCPDIYIHDEYAILDRLPIDAFYYWRGLLSRNRKIITAFNEGHSDGIYCNVADKIWLTNGESLPFDKHWPGMEVMELSTTNGGVVNHWSPVEKLFHEQEINKTRGRYVIHKHQLTDKDINWVDEYLSHWVGYCDETLFDINVSIVDENNVIAIGQNSLVYDKLESIGVKVHQVPFRHRFFWDGGIHCITNDLVRG